MKLVYTNENSLLVSHIRNMLENAGIPTNLRNEYAGGASGDLSFLSTWQELWVLDDEDYNRAMDLISQHSNNNASDWLCSTCGETNTAAFDFCWSCESENTNTSKI